MEYRIKTTTQKEWNSSPNTKYQIPNSVQKGLTLIELVVVVAIVAVLSASLIPSLLNFRRTSILNTETQELVTVINRARMLAVSSKNDQQFGVHFETGKVTLFQGATYTAGATTNEVRNFNSAVTGATTINGGGSDVLFAKVTGATNQNATTTLLVTGTTASTTVVVRQSGVVTIY